MLHLQHALAAGSLFLLCGCATLFPSPLNVGDSEAEVRTKWGQPTNVYQDGGLRILEYARGPYGQSTYMVRVAPGKGLVSVDQVLTDEKFASVEPGKTTREQILLTFGRPMETSYLPLKEYQVWTYAYKESGVWNSLMHVHFDRFGVVQMMLRGPDPRFELRERRR